MEVRSFRPFDAILATVGKGVVLISCLRLKSFNINPFMAYF